MNARVGTRLIVALAISLAFTSIAFGQTISFTNPAPPPQRQHIDMGFTAVDGPTDDPVLTKDVLFAFAVTGAAPTDQIKLVIDEAPPVLFAVGTPHNVTLGPGAHLATAWLVNGAGTERRTAAGAPVVQVTRFFLARVCDDIADCLDADPCTTATCNGAVPNTGDFHGGCRFGDTQGDADCCVTPEWCRYRGNTLDTFGATYQCADIVGTPDGVGDCVPCTQESHCQAVIDNELTWRVPPKTCKMNPVCTADNQCEFDRIEPCCTVNADCNDGNDCTTDTCDIDTQVCSNTAVAGCCRPGNDDLGIGAPDFGCTPVGGDPCVYYTCLGTGATAVCRSGPKYPGCCDAATDCTDATKLNVCTDSDGSGHGTCTAIDADPRYPDAGTCAYPKIDPLCCIKNYECSNRYPEFIGTCVNQVGQDWDICQYSANPEYCEAPVNAIVINEVMVNPGGTPPNVVADFYGEWFEVFNPTATDINMHGWTVEDLGEGAAKQSFVIDASGFLNVPAGGFRLFNRSNDISSNCGLIAGYVWPQTGFALDNDEDEIVLKDPAGVVQDQVGYTDAWPFTENAAMALINPYLDNTTPFNWATASLQYGDPRFQCKGTPRQLNADVFDEASTAGLTCDDGNPCTVDICNLDKADICSHKKLADCCTAATAATSCNDLNACTVDSCNTATNECVHTLSPNCCVSDLDCTEWYPATVTTLEQETEFDLCAYKSCVGGSCRFGRRADRPSCCVEATSPDFGCFDRNVCTADACVVDGGQDALGITFNQCQFDLDPNNDNIIDCCRVNTDCEDNDPSTLNVCDMLDDGQGPGVNRCWYKPDLNYCGPGAPTPLCDDDNVCTTDVCCSGAGAPDATCTVANRCVHLPVANCCEGVTDCVDGEACTTDTCVNGVCEHDEVAAGCCEAHADCNGPDKPADKYCRTGYCIGKVCRYGPAIAGCCVTPTDCSPTTCTTYQCTNHSCVAQQVPNCCLTGADCTPTGEQCTSNVCLQNVCTIIDVPNCCDDENPAGPDPVSCGDNNACTSDYCMQQGTDGPWQCRHFPTGGAGCCNTVDNCPDDNVHCTALSCDSNACSLNAVANCLALSPYKMTFTEGHSVYAGEYQSIADFSWATERLGTNAAESFWSLRTSGSLGPDQYLGFYPTATVATFDSCVVLPKFQTSSFSFATLGFDWAANHNSGTVTLRVLGRVGGTWNGATQLWTQNIAADAAPTHVNVLLPEALLNSDQTQVAFCVAGATTAAVEEVMLDQIALSQGQAPQLAAIANQSALKGQTKTVVDAFTITELDTDENVTLSFLNSPGSWVKIVNLHKLAGADTVWKADLEITSAVCPVAPGPYNYSLKVRASDGALEQTQSFVLAITGCP